MGKHVRGKLSYNVLQTKISLSHIVTCKADSGKLAARVGGSQCSKSIIDLKDMTTLGVACQLGLLMLRRMHSPCADTPADSLLRREKSKLFTPTSLSSPGGA